MNNKKNLKDEHLYQNQLVGQLVSYSVIQLVRQSRCQSGSQSVRNRNDDQLGGETRGTYRTNNNNSVLGETYQKLMLYFCYLVGQKPHLRSILGQ